MLLSFLHYPVSINSVSFNLTWLSFYKQMMLNSFLEQSSLSGIILRLPISEAVVEEAAFFSCRVIPHTYRTPNRLLPLLNWIHVYRFPQSPKITKHFHLLCLLPAFVSVFVGYTTTSRRFHGSERFSIWTSSIFPFLLHDISKTFNGLHSVISQKADLFKKNNSVTYFKSCQLPMRINKYGGRRDPVNNRLIKDCPEPAGGVQNTRVRLKQVWLAYPVVNDVRDLGQSETPECLNVLSSKADTELQFNVLPDL
jgi:hypothetical protein